MSKSYRLQHSVDYLKNREELFILKSMGRGWRSRRHSLETWTTLGSLEPVFVELEVWFLNCIFGFVGAILRLQLLLPIILNWKGISLSLSFFSWVVNLTHRSRVQFRSKSKKEQCFPSRLACKNWGFFSPYSPTISKVLIFSFLRFTIWEIIPGYLELVFGYVSGPQFLPHLIRGLRSKRTHDWEARLCSPPPSTGDAPQGWAPVLSCLLQI